MIKSAVLFTLLQVAATAFAAPAGYETQLMKLSKSLNGVPASIEDRRLLGAAVSAGKGDEFLRQKASDYLQRPSFDIKLKQKVDELVRLIPQTSALTDAQYGFNRKTAYDLFVMDIISKNQSWDMLLKGKNYSTAAQGSFSQNELPFYQRLLDDNFQDSWDWSKDETHLTQFQFDGKDQRIAGVITTPRFFDRYVNTALNKNRRRAAAIFRIFLCDTMIPTVPVQDSSSEKMDFDRIFPDHKDFTEGDIRKAATGNVHGQQADCMACHSKLDPLGQVFGFSAATLGSKPAPGALHYKGYDGREVNEPLRGFSDLAEKLTQQPEYVKCQVSNFWRWFVGKDVPLSAAREQELIKKFESVGRKPKDFVAYLVETPEFKEKPQTLTEDQLLSRRAVKIFRNCNSCHDMDPDANVWDLTDLPYSKDPRRREKMINTISKVLDVPGNGLKASMPPEESLWKLSPDEFEVLKKWIARGAPDYQGVPQVAPTGGTP